MTRKLCAMTLAAAVAGGVYLAAAQPAAASNMGFKLERNFEPVQDFENFFLVSFPLFNGLGDVAHTANLECVGAGGTGDGIINADDFLCDVWDRTPGSEITLSRYNIDTCSLESRTINEGFGGVPQFGGLWMDPLPRDEGFQVEALFATDASHPAVIVGSHDPSYTGRTLAGNAACLPFRQFAMIHLPYHTMYQTATEILCGLEGVDWQRDPTTGDPTFPFDVDGDGDVDADDACAGGMWDQATTTTITWFDNVADGTGPAGDDTDNSRIPRTVSAGFGGVPDFAGPDYDLIPGEAYIAELTSQDFGPTVYLSPHF